jgi:hypothetical protein
MTILIDKDRAIELLKIVVEGKRDFVYKADERGDDGEAYVDCKYVDDEGCPSCLIAHALHEAGATDAQLAEMDAAEDDSGIMRVPLPDGLELTNNARDVFGIAQSSQDFGRPWGLCLDEAIEFANALEGA